MRGVILYSDEFRFQTDFNLSDDRVSSKLRVTGWGRRRLTPWITCISPKDIFSDPDDCNRGTFAITTWVEVVRGPAIHSGSIATIPVWRRTGHRLQQFTKPGQEMLTVSHDTWVFQASYEQIQSESFKIMLRCSRLSKTDLYFLRWIKGNST